MTTNKTDFFREPGHFNFLVKTSALPESTAGDAGGRPLRDLERRLLLGRGALHAGHGAERIRKWSRCCRSAW